MFWRQVRLVRKTKLDVYGLALFFRPLVEGLLDDNASAGLFYFWRWVRLVRSTNTTSRPSG